MTVESGKSILITGASRGFGFALSIQFLKKRWRVLPLVRNHEDARVLKEADANRCYPIVSDVTHSSVITAIRESVASHGPIHVLINNAGLAGEGTALHETTADEVAALIDVHCLGVQRVTQAVLPHMHKHGVVINVSSRFGSISKVSTGQLDDIPCSYAYRIAKAAQNMLTQCMCREFRNTDIKICAIHPGRLKTDSASFDADKTPEEAALMLFSMLNRIEHGNFYSLFEGTLEW